MTNEPIVANVASIPERRDTLKNVVTRILPQVDHLNVYLNETPIDPRVQDYPETPRFLQHPKITVVWSQDCEFGDRGDVGKFYWTNKVKGIYFALDDDGLYPPNFVQHLVEGLLRYNKKAVVGLMGVLIREPVLSYYRSRTKYPAPKPLTKDIGVHLLGTGSICFHTDTIQVSPETDFPIPNMGDVWFALLGQKQSVPFICLRRPGKWMGQDLSVFRGSIFESSRRKDGTQKDVGQQKTDTVRRHSPWVVNTC